jgi:hypothetical protein
VKSAIVTAIEAVTPDSQASARDVFRHVDNAGRTGMRAPDRVFFVDAVGLPNRAELLTVDAYRVQMSITVLYSVAPGKTEDRVLSDCERISHALINLAAQDADLYAVEVTPLDMFENENTIEAQITVDAIYRLTGVA